MVGADLDADRIEAGVQTLKIPIAEQVKPRKIAIATSGSDRRQIDA